MTDGAENTIIAHTASIYPFSYSGTIIRPGAAPESGLKGVQRVMAKEYKLSPQRLKELQDEMNYLKTVREKEVADQIKEARSFGDLSENSEYDEAKNEQAKIEARIVEIEAMLKNVEIIEDVKGNTKSVIVGVKVKVLDEEYGDECEYRVVGSTEADPRNGKISDESPVGKALLGKKIGEEVIVEAPGGEFKLKILGISK